MTMTSNHGDRLEGGPRSRSAVPLSVVAVVLCYLLVGCGKKETAQAPDVLPADAQNANGQTAAAPDLSHAAPPQLAAPSGADLQTRDIHQMERVLVGWIISHHNRPKSFEEFVADTQIQVPPPPSGKKYVIAHNMHILLVDK